MNWVFLVLASAFFLAFRTILTKKISTNHSALPVLFYISLLSTLSIVFFHTNMFFSFPLHLYGLIIIKAFVISIAWISIFEVLKHVDVSIVAPLKNMSPLFLLVLSMLFLGERVSAINYAGIFLVVFSSYALELQSFRNFLEPLRFFKSRYFILIIISLIGNSISAVLDKVLLQTLDYLTVMFIFYLSISCWFLFFLCIRKEISSLSIFRQSHTRILIIALTFFALVSDFFYFMAVAIPGTFIILIMPLRRLDSLISTILGGRIFKESHLVYKSIVCLLLILASVLLVL
ncbi:MAG: EamA family transporter [Candidatus Woesearchaeota archaeon]